MKKLKSKSIYYDEDRGDIYLKKMDCMNIVTLSHVGTDVIISHKKIKLRNKKAYFV